MRVSDDSFHLVLLTTDAVRWDGFGNHPDCTVIQAGADHFDAAEFWRKASKNRVPGRYYRLELPPVFAPSADHERAQIRDRWNDEWIISEEKVTELQVLAERMGEAGPDMTAGYDRARGPINLPDYLQEGLWGVRLGSELDAYLDGFDGPPSSFRELQIRGLTLYSWSEELDNVGQDATIQGWPWGIPEELVDDYGRRRPHPVEEAFPAAMVVVFTSDLAAWTPIQSSRRFQVIKPKASTDYTALVHQVSCATRSGGQVLFVMDWKQSGWVNSRHPIRTLVESAFPDRSHPNVSWIRLPHLGPIGLPIVADLYRRRTRLTIEDPLTW